MTSLSRMNKAQLYEECKRLRDHNMRLLKKMNNLRKKMYNFLMMYPVQKTFLKIKKKKKKIHCPLKKK